MRLARVWLSLFFLAIIFYSTPLTSNTPTVGVEDPAISPDGQSLALIHSGRVLVSNLLGDEITRLSGVGEVQEHPSWSPDGNYIAFSALVTGRFRIYRVPSVGGTATEVPGMSELRGHARTPTWAGNDIVFVHEDLSGFRSDLMVVTPEGELVELTTNEAVDIMPTVSPDGARVAFVSHRSGDEEIWLISIQGGEATRLTFHRGEDRHPAWSPDGQRLVYSTERGGERYLAAIDADGGEPTVFYRGGGQPAWSRDGRFIILAQLPSRPRVYNGNPQRLPEWERVTLFSHRGAFELFSVPAPSPQDRSVSVAFPALESRGERNRHVFDQVVTIHQRLYYPAGPSRETWDGVAEQLRPLAEKAEDDTELEAVVDQLILERPLIKEEAQSQRAVIASAHPLATEVGIDVLRRGGNVVDAAVAVSFMLGVVEPDASGIGGDGMMMIHLKDLEKTVAIDFKDQTPSRATADNPALFENGRLKTHGPAAVNIPGVVAGMGFAFEKYGSGVVGWADLIAPAARAAAEGVEVTLGLATSLAEGEAYLEKYPAAAQLLVPEGIPLGVGDILVNEDYARTLQEIADEGANAFYRGSIADAIVRDMKTNGGIITAQDLSGYRAIEREPLVGHYRNFAIKTAPPPVASGASLIQMLHILDHYPLDSDKHFRSSADSFHYMVEAWKNISRKRLVADPHHWEVDLSEALSKDWARSRFEKIDPLKASPEPLLPVNEEDLEDYRRERISTGTTAAVVADSQGNMVALTQTLSTWGGACYVSEGLGFLYNNHLRGFRARPGRMGSLKPLARSSTGICPTLIFRRRSEDLVPTMAVGAAGNAWITASVYQLIAGIIDFGLSPQEAIESPRFLVRRKRFLRDRPAIAGRVQYEQSISGAVIREMRQRGHRFEPMGMKGELSMGFAAVAVVDIENGVVTAGAEPRRSHDAKGLQ